MIDEKNHFKFLHRKESLSFVNHFFTLQSKNKCFTAE